MREALTILILISNLFAISESAVMKKNSSASAKNILTKQNENIFDSIKYYNEKESLKKIKNLKNLNLADSQRKTLLHYAVLYKKYTLTKYLLKKGAKPYLQDAKGDTPLHIAVKNGDVEFIRLFLLSPGSSFALFIKNAKSLTPLDIALQRDDKNILSIFKSFLEDEELLNRHKQKRFHHKKDTKIKIQNYDNPSLL